MGRTTPYILEAYGEWGSMCEREETLVKIEPGLTGVPQRIDRQMFQLTFIALYNAQFRPGKSVL